jgi:undecaprenyl-diphosphatase
MTVIQAIVLGLVQGLTEFLPISSSGHLVLVPHLLGWTLEKDEAFIFFVLVQWGTLLAVFAYFWKDLLGIGEAMLASLADRTKVSAEAKLGWMVLLATLPAVAIGWLIKDQIEASFSSLSATGFFLLGTALLLTLAELLGKQKKGIEEVTTREAVLIGLFQVLSLFPGVSRSGATITGGMISQVRRRAAARFSFLMAIPVMVGAGILALFDLKQLENTIDFASTVVIGFLVSTFVGYFAIRWLLNYLSTRSLFPFAIYATLVGLVALFSS